MIEFVRMSYSYMHPRGWWEHVNFVARLPFAWRRYCKAMRGEYDGDNGN